MLLQRCTNATYQLLGNFFFRSLSCVYKTENWKKSLFSFRIIQKKEGKSSYMWPIYCVDYICTYLLFCLFRLLYLHQSERKKQKSNKKARIKYIKVEFNFLLERTHHAFRNSKHKPFFYGFARITR